MTQEEINRLAKRFYPVTEDIYGDDEARFERAAFKHGANYIISSPTDFGLVTLETMFEFFTWLHENCNSAGIEDGTFEYIIQDGVCKDLTLPELFQLFTTQNKEK